MEKIKEFYLELIKDDEFKARLAQFRQENGDDYEKIIEKLVLPQAKKMGYDFTKEDLLAYENENGENGLSDEELLNVAGGSMAQVTAIALATMMSLSSAAALLGGNQSASKQAMSSASPETSYTQMFEAETQDDGKEQENQDFNSVSADGEKLEIKNGITEETQKENEINNLSEKIVTSETKEKNEIDNSSEKIGISETKEENATSQKPTAIKGEKEKKVEGEDGHLGELFDQKDKGVNSKKEISLYSLTKQMQELVKSTKEDCDTVHKEAESYIKEANTALKNGKVSQTILNNLNIAEPKVKNTISKLNEAIGRLKETIGSFENKVLTKKEKKAIQEFRRLLADLESRLEKTQGLSGRVELYQSRLQSELSDAKL